MRKMVRRGLMAAAVAFSYICYVYLTVPDVRPLARTNPQTTTFVQLRIREAQEEGRRLAIRQRWVPYTQISSNLRRAVLVAEDSAFFDHEGIDLQQIRASLEVNWEEGRFMRGASTITQQLAKNLYLSPSRNPVRKLKELLITRRLEAALTKRRILEIYLNVIEWGDGIFGCEAASYAYFGKPAAALSVDEAALLAGAIINPRQHNPGRPTPRLLRRQQIIIRRMGIKPPPKTTVSSATVVEPSVPPMGLDPVGLGALNGTPPEPPDAVQSLQPEDVDGVQTPINQGNPTGSPSKNAAGEADMPPRPAR